MFSLLHGVVIRPLPYPQADRLVMLYTSEEPDEREGWSGADFLDLGAQGTSFRSLAGFRSTQYSTTGGEFPVTVQGASVTSSFFPVLGVPPLLGRSLSPATDPPGGDRVVVLSHGFWTSRVAADPAILGRPLELNGETYTVVGVMPEGFELPRRTQLWSASRSRCPDSPVPIGDSPDENRGAQYFSVVGRLVDGVSLDRAGRELESIAARLAHAYPDTNRNRGFLLASLHETVVGAVKSTLLTLFGAVLLVLLIACANVANLLLAQASGRAHEMAIRAALGAGRGRIARTLLAESLLLGLAGAAGGVMLAFAATEVLVTLAGVDLPRVSEISVDLPVLAFALAAALLSSVLFGLAPVLWLTRRDPAGALRGGGGRSVAGRVHGRTRAALVVMEMAVSLSLLVAAGLLARSLATVGAVDPGFSERQALTARVFLPGGQGRGDDEIRVFQRQVLERARALPGVASAGAVMSLPVDPGIRGTLTFNIEGRTYEEGSEPVAGFQVASDGYFESIGIPVRQGRAFTPGDGPEAEPVTVVSQAFAARFFPHENPIGRRLGWGDPEGDGFKWCRVVGVVGDTRRDGLDAEPAIEAYRPMAQAPWPYMTLVLRTTVPPGTLGEPLRRAILEVSPTQPVEKIQTMDQALHNSLARRRVTMLLLGVFAGVGLTLAAVGLYGVMSFSVALRSREIGIRMAVGATSRTVLTFVLEEAWRLLAVGLAIGAVGTLALGHLLTGLLYKVRPTDPLTFLAAGLVLSLAALAAAALPALRAARTNPMTSLRDD
jgi:putative ABC transport system permease protein